MSSCSFLLSHLPIKGYQPQISKPGTFPFSKRYKFSVQTRARRVVGCTLCYTKLGDFSNTEFPQLDSNPLDKIVNLHALAHILKIDDSEPSRIAASFGDSFVIADLNPATAKLAIGILGPALSAFGFLFILRIVMSWYPNLPVEKFPYVLAYAPTEPLLVVTRKVIPPLGGVDVTPVVWFGLVSFLNEILVGPQGLLVLLSQQVN